MRQRAVGGHRQGLRDQPLGAVQIVVREIGQLIEHPDSERDRQPGGCIDRLRVERQRGFEIFDRLVVIFL